MTGFEPFDNMLEGFANDATFVDIPLPKLMEEIDTLHGVSEDYQYSQAGFIGGNPMNVMFDPKLETQSAMDSAPVKSNNDGFLNNVNFYPNYTHQQQQYQNNIFPPIEYAPNQAITPGTPITKKNNNILPPLPPLIMDNNNHPQNNSNIFFHHQQTSQQLHDHQRNIHNLKNRYIYPQFGGNSQDQSGKTSEIPSYFIPVPRRSSPSPSGAQTENNKKNDLNNNNNSMFSQKNSQFFYHESEPQNNFGYQNHQGLARPPYNQPYSHSQHTHYFNNRLQEPTAPEITQNFFHQKKKKKKSSSNRLYLQQQDRRTRNSKDNITGRKRRIRSSKRKKRRSRRSPRRIKSEDDFELSENDGDDEDYEFNEEEEEDDIDDDEEFYSSANSNASNSTSSSEDEYIYSRKKRKRRKLSHNKKSKKKKKKKIKYYTSTSPKGGSSLSGGKKKIIQKRFYSQEKLIHDFFVRQNEDNNINNKRKKRKYGDWEKMNVNSRNNDDIKVVLGSFKSGTSLNSTITRISGGPSSSGMGERIRDGRNIETVILKGGRKGRSPKTYVNKISGESIRNLGKVDENLLHLDLYYAHYIIGHNGDITTVNTKKNGYGDSSSSEESEDEDEESRISLNFQKCNNLNSPIKYDMEIKRVKNSKEGCEIHYQISIEKKIRKVLLMSVCTVFDEPNGREIAFGSIFVKETGWQRENENQILEVVLIPYERRVFY